MEAIHIEQVIEQDGELKLNGLPFKKGEHVEIIVSSGKSTEAEKKLLTARQLLDSPLVGLWKTRTDIEDSTTYACQLREQAQKQNLK